MTGVLVHCTHCGYTGTVDWLIKVSPGVSARVTFVDSSAKCPNCDRAARILDGAFEYRDEVIRVLSAPGWTRAKLEELRDALQWARLKMPEDAGAALSRLAEVDAGVGGLVLGAQARGWNVDRVIALISMLLAAAALLASVWPKGPSEVQIAPEQVRQIIEQMNDPASTPDDSPGTAPPSRGERKSPAGP